MAPINLDTVHDAFTYKAPVTPEKQAAYTAITEAGEAFARVILQHAPASADTSTAVRCVREARMWANSAIANDGRF